MYIRFASLRLGENKVEEVVDPGEINLDPAAFTQPVNITGVIDNDGNMLDVRLNVVTTGRYECDRCAIEFDQPFDFDLRLHVVRHEGRDADESGVDGLIHVSEQASELDISNEIRDSLILDIPMKILCKEDCKGLCFKCGADLNEETCSCEK